MHISLDSALGRQRRLNSVGESVLQIAPNAAAAYSLRSLTGGDPKVVRVRRDVDNTEQDFTASGISSGALVDFATSGNGVFANTGYESFTNASASGFTASNTGSTGFAVSDILDGVSGDSVSVSFDIDITNGSPTISLRTALSGGSTASNGIVYTTSGSKTATLTGNKGYVGVGFTEGDAPSNFTVSNFKVLGNGFVETWYDQSGNSNDAVQATAGSQPKIVNAGSLVTSSGLASIKFDGTNDTLTADSLASVFSGTDKIWSHFSVTEFTTDATTLVVASLGSSSSNSPIIYSGGRVGQKYGFFVRDDANANVLLESGTLSVNEPYLNHATTNGAAQAQFVNSSAAGTGSTNTGAMTFNRFTLGCLRRVNTDSFLNGSISEFIIHNSNQSANRVAIETNINSHYSIF